MKRLMTATAIAALTATVASAQSETVTIEALDLNSDGFATVEEAMAWFPDMQFESFNDIDLNDDNRLDADEVQTADAQAIFGQYDMRPMEEATARIVLDADGDGFIMMEDYQRAYPSFEMSSFEIIDTNDDNRVSYSEHYDLAAQTEIGRYEGSSMLEFADLDSNSDDFVDFDEMTVAYPNLPMESFEQIDINDDNRVSADELNTAEAQEIVGAYM